MGRVRFRWRVKVKRFSNISTSRGKKKRQDFSFVLHHNIAIESTHNLLKSQRTGGTLKEINSEIRLYVEHIKENYEELSHLQDQRIAESILMFQEAVGNISEIPDLDVEDVLRNIESSEAKQQILGLLLEALSETDPREILIYGMYVKKCLSPIVRSTRKGSIEKTMQLLTEALGKK